MSTLHVLQMELTALVDKNSHLYDFDGGRIKCADPPDMKGMKPLHMINCKSISLLTLFYDKKKLQLNHIQVTRKMKIVRESGGTINEKFIHIYYMASFVSGQVKLNPAL